MKTYYEQLGLAANTYYGCDSYTSKQIEAAYRKVARKWHPDKNSHPEAATISARINYAYSILKDPQKKTAYDNLIYGRQVLVDSSTLTEHHGSYTHPRSGSRIWFDYTGPKDCNFNFQAFGQQVHRKYKRTGITPSQFILTTAFNNEYNLHLLRQKKLTLGKQLKDQIEKTFDNFTSTLPIDSFLDMSAARDEFFKLARTKADNFDAGGIKLNLNLEKHLSTYNFASWIELICKRIRETTNEKDLVEIIQHFGDKPIVIRTILQKHFGVHELYHNDLLKQLTSYATFQGKKFDYMQFLSCRNKRLFPLIDQNIIGEDEDLSPGIFYDAYISNSNWSKKTKPLLKAAKIKQKKLALEKKLNDQIKNTFDDFTSKLPIASYLDMAAARDDFFKLARTIADNFETYGLKLDLNPSVFLISNQLTFGVNLICKRVRETANEKDLTEIIQHFGDHPIVINTILQKHFTKHELNHDNLLKQLTSYATFQGKKFDYMKFLSCKNKSLFPLIDQKIIGADQHLFSGILYDAYISDTDWSEKIPLLKAAKVFADSDYHVWLKETLFDRLDEDFNKNSKFSHSQWGKISPLINSLKMDLSTTILKHIDNANGALPLQALHDDIEKQLTTFAQSKAVGKYRSFKEHFLAVIGVFLAVPLLILPIICSASYRATFFHSTAKKKALRITKGIQAHGDRDLSPIALKAHRVG